DTVVYLRIVDGGGHVNLIEAVAVLVFAAIGVFLLTQARQVAVVVATTTLAQLTENLFQRRLADGLLTFGRNPYFAGTWVVAKVTPVFQLLDKVAHAIIIVRKPILLIQFIEPRQRFGGVARSILQQLHEKFQQLIESAFRQYIGYIFRKVIAAHRRVTPFCRSLGC